MTSTPFPTLFKIRADFPLEIGFVDAVREPMPRDSFGANIARWGERIPEPLHSYDTYCKIRATYRSPPYMGYMAVHKPGDDMYSMIVTDGNHLFYAEWPGLYESVVLRLAAIMKVKSITDLPIFPKTPASETKVVFPEQLIIHDTSTGDAGLLRWEERKRFIGGLERIFPIFPPSEGDEWSDDLT